MPFQGNDNRSTVAWLPKAAVAPSAAWNSTYGVHYTNPGKRGTAWHDYWLKKAAARAAAREADARNDIIDLPRTSALTFRDPSLALAYNQPIRNPSSMPRSASATGLLTVRAIHPSLRDTSKRSYNSFQVNQTQRFYEPGFDVSALKVLEGQAAGEDNLIPLQATARPALHTTAFGTSPLPQKKSSSQRRPASAAPRTTAPKSSLSRSQTVSTFVPAEPQHISYRTAVPVDRWGEEIPAHESYLGESIPSRGHQSRPASARSATYRPQLAAARTHAVPANRLLDVAAAPDRYERRAQEFHTNQRYDTLEL